MPQFKDVDDVEFEDTKIKDLDDLFGKASDPMNLIVDASNGLSNAVRSVKKCVLAEPEGDDKAKAGDAAAAPKALGFAKFVLNEGALGFVVTSPAGENLAQVPRQAAGSFKRIEKKVGLVRKRLAKLKQQDDTWNVELVDDGESIKLVRGTGADKDIKDMDRSFTKLTTRFIDLQEDLLPQVELKAVFGSAFSTLQKSGIKPEVNFGDRELSYDFKDADKALEKKPLLKRIIDALKALFEAIKNIICSIPDLIPQITDLVSTAKSFTIDKVKEMATGSGLGPMEIVKAVKNFGTNVKNLASIPGTLDNVVSNNKTVIAEVKGAISGAGDPGAAAAE